jgi:hypothetical protein
MGKLAHQCHADGCESVAEFEVHLHIRCPRPGAPATEVNMQSTINVCAKHQDKARWYLLEKQNQESITVALMDGGYPEPDFFQSRVEFKPIVPDRIEVIVPCTREGCANPARYRVRQVFPEHGRREPRLNAMTNFYVCEACRKKTTAADLLDDEARASTKAWLNQNGVLLPDLDRMTIEFVPVGNFKVI